MPDASAGASVRPAYNPAALGRQFPPAFAEATADGIRAFARAIGETAPIHHDHHAAVAAGYAGVVAPPTYIFVIKYGAMNPADVLQELGIEGAAGKLLHAEQSFDYVRPIVAGDRLRFDERVAEIYEKRGGALVFVVIETIVADGDDRRVATIRHTEVVRVDA